MAWGPRVLVHGRIDGRHFYAPLSGHYVDEACELKFEQPLRLHVHHVHGAHGRDVELRDAPAWAVVIRHAPLLAKRVLVLLLLASTRRQPGMVGFVKGMLGGSAQNVPTGGCSICTRPHEREGLLPRHAHLRLVEVARTAEAMGRDAGGEAKALPCAHNKSGCWVGGFAWIVRV